MKTGAQVVWAAYLVVVSVLMASASGEPKYQGKSASPGDDEKVYTQSQVDEKAVIDRKSRDENFPTAEGCGERQGSVLLRVVLHRSGKVTGVEVRRGDACKKFEERAIKAVRKVKFTPAKKGGGAVSQYAMFEYNYKVW